MNTIENEFHLLSQCSFYKNERTDLFNKIKNTNGNFVFLNNIDKATCRRLLLKVIYKGSFKSFVALCADRICSDQHFVENCIEKFPSV